MPFVISAFELKVIVSLRICWLGQLEEVLKAG